MCELRRPALDLDALGDVVWNPQAAEFVAAANSVSLLMPFVEPWFAASVRRSVPLLPAADADTARTFVRQELEHQRQHRRFNEVLTGRFHGLERPQRRMRSVYGWLARRCSLEFGLAFAASSETIAYSLARWTSDHLAEFMRGADPVAVDLFVWHLAEEVEHKSVAFDAWEAVDGSRWRYVRGGVLSLTLLAWFSLWSILVMLHAERRLRRPGTWWRLARLVLSFAFEVLPTMLQSSLSGHHPDQLTDPAWYSAWLVDMELRHRLVESPGRGGGSGMEDLRDPPSVAHSGRARGRDDPRGVPRAVGAVPAVDPLDSEPPGRAVERRGAGLRCEPAPPPGPVGGRVLG